MHATKTKQKHGMQTSIEFTGKNTYLLWHKSWRRGPISHGMFSMLRSRNESNPAAFPLALAFLSKNFWAFGVGELIANSPITIFTMGGPWIYCQGMPQCFQAALQRGFYACHGAFLLMDPTLLLKKEKREGKKPSQ